MKETTMTNDLDALRPQLPALPDGYRWKVEAVSYSGYVYVILEQLKAVRSYPGLLPFFAKEETVWVERFQQRCEAGRGIVEDTAQKIYEQWALVGTYPAES